MRTLKIMLIPSAIFTWIGFILIAYDLMLAIVGLSIAWGMIFGSLIYILNMEKDFKLMKKNEK